MTADITQPLTEVEKAEALTERGITMLRRLMFELNMLRGASE